VSERRACVEAEVAATDAGLSAVQRRRRRPRSNRTESSRRRRSERAATRARERARGAGAACNCQIYTLPVDSLLVARTPSQLLGECSGLRSPQRRSRLSSRPQSPRTYCTAREDEFDSSELLVAESAAGSHTECKEWPAARSTASCS
jgi:hypothetical protein